MKHKMLIILGFVAVLSACSTVQIGPLDDAYYYPDKRESAVQTAQAPQSVRQHPKANSQQPSVEYVNVQDTTVTIRIKR